LITPKYQLEICKSLLFLSIRWISIISLIGRKILDNERILEKRLISKIFINILKHSTTEKQFKFIVRFWVFTHGCYLSSFDLESPGKEKFPAERENLQAAKDFLFQSENLIFFKIIFSRHSKLSCNKYERPANDKVGFTISVVRNRKKSTIHRQITEE